VTDRFHRLSVSVIVPVYEHADYLGEALHSVAQQTSPPEEVLVVVDGPPVDLTAALDAIDGRARVLHRSRGGPGAARNTGCNAATGTLLAFLDSDDIWLPTKLERQLTAFAEDPQLDMVFASVEQFFSPELGRTGEPQRHVGAERAGIATSAMLVRAASFRSLGGFREGGIFGEMFDFYARAVDADMHATTVEEVLVRRRVHDRNTGVQFRSARDEYATVVKSVLDRRRGGRTSE
jgi:glycosyltransferase involved in cell wall biosynthesis